MSPMPKVQVMNKNCELNRFDKKSGTTERIRPEMAQILLESLFARLKIPITMPAKNATVTRLSAEPQVSVSVSCGILASLLISSS